jgi:TonB family protein
MKFPILPFDSVTSVRCVIRMVINKEGKVQEPKFLASSGFPDFDDDALRVMKLSPDWLPGKSGGKFVNSYFTIPVKYKK